MSKCSIKCSCKAHNFICTELYKCEGGEWKCTSVLSKEAESEEDKDRENGYVD